MGESIINFNNLRKNELKIIFNKCNEYKNINSLEKYVLSWETGNKEVFKDEDSENDYLNYYWIEFKNENNRKYKISLFYKDFDSNTGNIHVLPGPIQIWKYNENSGYKDFKHGLGIHTYNEFGWEPVNKNPIFSKDLNKLIIYISKVLDAIRDNQDVNELFEGEVLRSSDYYKEFISEKNASIKEYVKESNKKGKLKKGHYLKYSLITWLEFDDDYTFESLHEKFEFPNLGYFSKFGLNNSQIIKTQAWKLDIPKYEKKK